jgi:isocitrate dehydrogenase kinase/phosphatase
MGSNYENYALPRTVGNPEEECIEWFWTSLNEDDVYPKEFLEHLMQLADDIETGKEKVIPLDEDFFDRLKDLVKDVD